MCGAIVCIGFELRPGSEKHRLVIDAEQKNGGMNATGRHPCPHELTCLPFVRHNSPTSMCPVEQ